MAERTTIRQVIKNKSDVLTFGKFKESTIMDILHDEPEYILWLDNNEIVDFPEEIIEEAEDRKRPDPRDDMGSWDLDDDWGDRD